jgi:hypothetical protein
MDRAGKVLRKLNMAAECLSNEDIARAAWPSAVGRFVASRTRAVKLYGSRLVVEVEDAVWKSQLETLERQILPKLQTIAGQALVHRIEFREAPPRIPPRRAELNRDEANRIEDAALRLVYKASRKRALGS